MDNIENGLLYGKSLDKFYGMDRLLREWSEKNNEVTDIRVLSADKREVYYQVEREASAFDKRGRRQGFDRRIHR